MGARLQVLGEPTSGAPSIDVQQTPHGETFVLDYRARRMRRGNAGAEPVQDDEVQLEVVDLRTADRHLLLLMRQGTIKSKFLCGHDERHWFVAAVPESAGGVTGVETAKAALQPAPVRTRAAGLKRKHRNSRRNDAFIRQGEWFFLPAPQIEGSIDPHLILRSEPLLRGASSKPHILAEAYRTGGRSVWIHRSKAPSGISEKAYQKLAPGDRTGFTQQRVDPELYVRGAVRHADHATIHLNGWHRVLMNTESAARAMRHVAFLD